MHSCKSEITILEDIHPLVSSSEETNTIYMIYSSSSPSLSSVVEYPYNLSARFFNNDEDILESLLTLDNPCDDIHHRSYFVLDEPSSSLIQYSIEAKYFICGSANLFINPILAPYSFEEGNMDNISPAIMVNI